MFRKWRRSVSDAPTVFACYAVNAKFSENRPPQFSIGVGVGWWWWWFTGTGSAFDFYLSSPQNYNYTIFKFSENEYLTKARSGILTLWHICTLFSDNKPSQSIMAVVGFVLFLVRLPERHHVIDLNVRDNHAYCQRMNPRFFKAILWVPWHIK